MVVGRRLLYAVCLLAVVAAAYWRVASRGPSPPSPSEEPADCQGVPAIPSLLGVRWDFTDGSIAAWRHKDNTEIAIAVDGQNKALRLSSAFAPHGFAWATRYFEPHSAEGVVHVVFRVRGDGSGHRLQVHLGAPSPRGGKWLYYINARQTVTLDFTGWRRVSLDLDQFATPDNGLRERDLARLGFVEFMVHASDAKKPVEIWLDDIEFTPATPEELAAQERRRQTRARLVEKTAQALAQTRQRLAELGSQLDRAAHEGKHVATARAYHGALVWCADDLQRYLDAEELELVEKAGPLLASLDRRLEDPRAVLRHVLDRPPQEPDRLNWADNRYFRSVVGGVRPWIESERSWAKGRKGYRSIPDAWSFRGFGDALFGLVWSITRPASPLRHHPLALRNALSLLDTIAHQHVDGDFNVDRTAVHGRDENINRFCLAPALDAWRELQAAYPDLLPDAWQADLEAGLKRLVDYQVADYGTARLARRPDIKQPAYPNMDVHYLLIMELAWQRWNEPRYAHERDAFLRILEQAVYPGGAFPYLHTQNECFVYHRIDVAYLARYWKLSGNPAALELLRKTIPYYPYNVEPAGMPEYYTDPCWKHYWTGGDAIGPGIIASLFGDAHNQQVADACAISEGYGRGHEAAIAAECWKPVQAKPLPDQYVFYDQNIEGPRGRYGAWSFAGNGRNYGVGFQGKDTFVGAMITRPPKRRELPLDAALQVVTTEVRLNHTDDHWTGGRCHSAQERLSTALGPDFGSLAVRYTVSRPQWHYRYDELLPWQGTQTWYLSKSRLVGLVSLEATADETKAAVHGRIRLGMKRALEPIDPKTWRYGRLVVRIHEHNYAGIVVKPSETTFQDPPDVRRSTEITLLDPQSVASGERGTVRFPKGTHYWFLVGPHLDEEP
ncbi:MAG: hypothetical protein NUV77_25500, partial [Thermoguttaceae bacterium]|nr:hypothetical protein [Thermoguttaceae bacterium]